MFILLRDRIGIDCRYCVLVGYNQRYLYFCFKQQVIVHSTITTCKRDKVLFCDLLLTFIDKNCKKEGK